MDYTTNLNPAQREAVLATTGPLLLIAGAGSGKTRVITHRAAHIIETGVSPFNILAITFTNKAAKEMRERIANLSPRGAECWVSTFHSMCCQILRREIGAIGYSGTFTIYDMDDCKKLMKLLLGDMNIDEKKYPPQLFLTEIGKQKDELIGPSDYAALAHAEGDHFMGLAAQVYSRYQKRLYAANALDFDDIINKTVELFISCPDVLEQYRQRFWYIMVDEYQDTNTAQYQLIRLLAGGHDNLCVVGDDDQSIYGWRGANIRNILDFEKDFPGARVIKLEQNYRSSGRILAAANAVIAKNFGRKHKELWTDAPQGVDLEYQRADSDYEEAEFIVREIIAGLQGGARHSDFAVLYRTNAQSRLIEDRLVRRNIRYRIFGGVRFYERREIKDVLAYLRAICNPADDISLRRIINVPRRGIGGGAIDAIDAHANAHDLSFFAAMTDIEEYSDNKSRNKKILEFLKMIKDFQDEAQVLPVAEMVRLVLERTGYLEELKREDKSENTDRAKNVAELVNKAAEFEGSGMGLAEFLEEVALVADIDDHDNSDDTVALMTLHSSKGLEFPIVFLPGLEDGLFPGGRAINDPNPDELEEERRLLYVGITRARERLILLSAGRRMQYGRIQNQQKSRFLGDIPPELFGKKIAKPKLAVGKKWI
ncbi:MAG: UvrD-helicase domain-containing protein [Defluviitaleaceae bacterium]|nr:UvrD-helicase domain-containing protein [Defluviitaleaceae bacterium]